MELPEGAGVLFETAPEEFTAERNRIAGQLRRQGDEAGAVAVKDLKRPSLPAYGLNLVARRDPELIGELLDAGERVRTAASRPEMDRAKADRQRAIAGICSAAVSLLTGEGRTVTSPMRERMTESLLAVATDDETRERLRTGTLLKEAVPGGLGGPVGTFTQSPEDERARRLQERVEGLQAEADARLGEAVAARAEAERLEAQARELAEASADAAARAKKMGNLARQAEEWARARQAEAEALR